MSYFHAYMDLKYEREMPFDHLPGLFSYAVYTAEITEMPEEVYPSYYMVKIGDNALMVTHIKKELEKCNPSSASLYVASIDDACVISVKKGTVNTLSDGTSHTDTYTDSDGEVHTIESALFSRDDPTPLYKH